MDGPLAILLFMILFLGAFEVLFTTATQSAIVGVSKRHHSFGHRCFMGKISPDLVFFLARWKRLSLNYSYLIRAGSDSNPLSRNHVAGLICIPVGRY